MKLNSSTSASSNNKLDVNFQNKFIQHLINLSEFNYLFIRLTLDLVEKGNLIIKSANFKVLPKNFDDLLKLYFNLKFQSRASYDRLASHIFTILLGSNRPLSLDEIYETLNCAHLINEKITHNDLIDQINSLDDFISPFLFYDPDFDNLEKQLTHLHINGTNAAAGVSSVMKGKLVRTTLYTFAQPAVRDWWCEYHRVQSKLVENRRKCQYTIEWSYFLLAFRLFRSLEFNQRLRNLKYASNVKMILDEIKYLIRASDLFENNFNIVAYLLSLYLPSNSVNKSSTGSRQQQRLGY